MATTTKSTKKTGSDSKTTKSSTAKSKTTYKPGEYATKDLKLFVKDSRGKTLGEINVPSNSKIPPTAKKKAASYETKK